MTDYSSLINRWYQSVQFRYGPTPEVQNYNNQLNSGAQTEAQVQQSIIGSVYSEANVNPIIREYQVAFNRVPDQQGERYWTSALASGALNINQITYAFTSAPEFYAIYGVTADSTINAATLTKFYENMFCRAPDAAGLQYWLNRGLTTAATLTAFVTSPEAKSITSGSIPAYQQAEILGTEATTGSLFQYGGCTDAPITIQMQITPQTIDVKEPTDKVNVETVQQPVGSTWITGSVVNGGGNTDINLKMNGNPNGGATGSTVTANKILDLNVNLADSGNLDASQFNNVSNIIINNGLDNKALTIDSAQLSSNYNISLNKAITMKFSSFANALGSADTLLLNGNNAGSSISARATFDFVGDNKIESVDLNQTGTNYLDLNTGSTVSKIILEGSGTSNVNIAAGSSGFVAGNLSVFDASRFNGDLTAKFDAGATSGLSSLPNITGSQKSTTLIFERAFDNNSDIAINLQGTGAQRLGYSDGGILTKTYDIFGGNGQFFISSDGTAIGSAFTNGDTGVKIGDGNNYINLGSGNDIVQVGNGNNTVYTGGGQDIIELGNGNNIVSGGAGADLFYTGGLNVTSLYTAIGQTGNDTATGNSVSTNNFDHYWGVQNGYKLQFSFLPGGFSAGSTTSTTSVAGVNNAIVYVRGDEVSGTFTASATGRDTLIVYDTDATSGTNFEAVVFNTQYAASSTATVAPTPSGGQAATSTVSGTVVQNAITASYTTTSYRVTSNYIPAGVVQITSAGNVTAAPSDLVTKIGTPTPNTVQNIDAFGLNTASNGTEIIVDQTVSPSLNSVVGSNYNDVINIAEMNNTLSVTGGTGVDGISINRTGSPTFTANYTAAGQTGLQVGVGNNVDTSLFDEYMGLQNGDKFNLSISLSSFENGVKTSWTSVAGNNDAITFVEGSYSGNLFTATPVANGASKATLVVYDTKAGVDTRYEGILLLDDYFSGTVNGHVVTLTSAPPPVPPNDVIVDVTSRANYLVSGTSSIARTVDANYIGRNLYPSDNVHYVNDSINNPLMLENIDLSQLQSNISTAQTNTIRIDFGGTLYQTELLPQLKSAIGTNAADLFQVTGTSRFVHGISMKGGAGDDVFNFSTGASVNGQTIDGGTGLNKITLNEASSFSGNPAGGYGFYGFAGPGPKYRAAITNIDTIELSNSAQASSSTISANQATGIKHLTGFNVKDDGFYVQNNSGSWNAMASSVSGVTTAKDWFFEYSSGKGSLYYIDTTTNQLTHTDVVGTTGGMQAQVYSPEPSFLSVLAL